MEESQGVKIRDKNPDQDMMLELTAPGSVLGPGAMTRIGRTNEQGEKALMESLTNESAKKKKAKTPKQEEDTPKEMVPKTVKEEALAQKTEVLKSATDARKYAISLKHLNYSGELVQQLMSYSTKMEKLFETITDYDSQADISDAKWKAIVKQIAEQTKWYEQAEAC